MSEPEPQLPDVADVLVSTTEIEDGQMSRAALTWGQTNERGEFTLEAPLPPGRYGVAVMARDYLFLAEDNSLVITDKTPRIYDPWSTLRLLRTQGRN